MLADLTPIIRHGLIDNTAQGHIRLKLWCEGEAAPISLEMEGNCMRDIAGCRVSFRLTGSPEEGEERHRDILMRIAHDLCHADQPIIAGDMTLSRRFALPEHKGKVSNILSLEFFLGTKIRFVIETEEFEFEISLPEWECSRACESAQEIINMSALRDHVLANVAAFRGPSLMFLGTAEMPACRWDYALNRAEAYMLIAPSIQAKYAGHPRGKLAEAFVLDRLDYLHAAAADEEKGYTFWHERPHSWEVLDFMEPEDSKLARASMRHPLFGATAQLSQIIQKHVIAHLSQYADNKDIESMLSAYSGIISHVLATIMLEREKKVRVEAISARAESLYARMEQLLRYSEALKPTSKAAFRRGAETLLSELKEFLCKLRR